MNAFTGREALERKLSDLARALAKPRVLRVGFLGDKTYPDGTPVAMVAAIQEFGAPSRNIPPRPFFRTMIAAKSPQWGTQLAGLIENHGYEAGDALGVMGVRIADDLRQSILDLVEPPLKAATIDAKTKPGATAVKHGILGPAKPLVDTGLMLNSIDAEIIE